MLLSVCAGDVVGVVEGERASVSLCVGEIERELVAVKDPLVEVDRVAVRSGLVNEMVSDATEDMV